MAHNQSDLEEGIVATLIADTTSGSLYSLLGETNSARVFIDEAPDNATLPTCVVRVLRDTPARYFDNDDIDAEVEITLEGKEAEPTNLSILHDKLLAYDEASVTITGHNGGKMIVVDRGTKLTANRRTTVTTAFRVFATSQ